MNLERIRAESYIRVRGVLFEVLSVSREADFLEVSDASGVRMFISVLLHEVGNASVLPTHELHYYPLTKRVVWCEGGRESAICIKDVVLERNGPLPR